MITKTLIKNISMVNEGQTSVTDVLIEDGIIQKIGNGLQYSNAQVIDGLGKFLFPGVIDAQVHFREPGLTHKGDLLSESKAAVAGGVTSFIDMPNTQPNVLTPQLLQQKYNLAAEKSVANFGFFMGVNADNIDSVIDMDKSQILAVSDDGLYFTKKGNLLADNPEILEKLFANCKSIIAIHAEKEAIIEANEKLYFDKYGEDVPIACHPLIRSHNACYRATQQAIELADKYKARLHILHLTTQQETNLFRNDIPLKQKNITTEVAVQHLWFCDKDYTRLGALIKWNPAIKTENDREALLQALLDDRIDIITTDHAPHAMPEKQQTYFKSMSGAPMVQHALNIMLEFYKRGKISLEKIGEKMCHNPATLYNIANRGFIREGYHADLTIVDLNTGYTVNKDNILYKCGWSPLEGTAFSTTVTHTFVNGNPVYCMGNFNLTHKGMPLVKNG